VKPIEKRILKINLQEDRVKVLKDPPYVTAHNANLRAVWYFNILNKKLDYSTTAKSHQDSDKFKEPLNHEKGWIRGRVFEDDGKYYIFVYLEDWLHWPITRNTINSIYTQIQKVCDYDISDVLDADGYSLTENKKGKK